MGVERGRGPRAVYLNGVYFKTLKDAAKHSKKAAGQKLEVWEIYRLLEFAKNPLPRPDIPKFGDEGKKRRWLKANISRIKLLYYFEGIHVSESRDPAAEESDTPQQPKQMRPLLVNYRPLEMGISPRYVE